MLEAFMKCQQLLTTKEAAAILGVHHHTLTKARSYRTEPMIPFVRVGGTVRYKPDDIEAYIESRTERPDAADAR